MWQSIRATVLLGGIVLACVLVGNLLIQGLIVVLRPDETTRQSVSVVVPTVEEILQDRLVEVELHPSVRCWALTKEVYDRYPEAEDVIASVTCVPKGVLDVDLQVDAEQR